MTPKQLADAGEAGSSAILESATAAGGSVAVVMVIVDLEEPGKFTTASTDPFLTQPVLEAALRACARVPDSHEIRPVSIKVRH